MRAVIQRVGRAQVVADGVETGRIGVGLVVYLGIGREDDADDIAWLSSKIARLRLFPDDAGRMNRSVQDIGGGCLVISQFTLFASTKKGTRPSFVAAAPPERAIPLYERFLAAMRCELPERVAAGVFAADMAIDAVVDGPVTITIDSRRRE